MSSKRKKASHTWRILIWLQVPILLVGNKVDLEHQREVPTVEGMVSSVILPLENLSKILVLQTRQKWDFFAVVFQTMFIY